MDITYNIKGNYKPTLKRFADLNGPDFFPTPSWAVFALIDNEKFEGDIWECACGDGAISKILEYSGYNVYSTDLYDRGYGEHGIDFLKTDRKCSNIITNPPYNSAENFIHIAIKSAEKKFAFLLRLAFLEGVNRAKSIFFYYPPSRVWVFSERLTFYPSGIVKRGSGTTAYAWFVWDKNAPDRTELRWINPGYKKS